MNEDTPMQASVVEGDGEGNNEACMDTIMNEQATDRVVVLENSSEQVPPNPQDMNTENVDIMEQKYWKDTEVLKRQLEWLLPTTYSQIVVDHNPYKFTPEHEGRTERAINDSKNYIESAFRDSESDPKAFYYDIIEGFQHCPVLHFGFHCLIEEKASVCCCPFGRRDMEPWRLKYAPGFDTLCDYKKLVKPFQLLQHLRDTKGRDTRQGKVHDLLFVYLDSFYKDFTIHGLNHKAFYPQQSPNYNKIVKVEMYAKHRLMQQGIDRINRLSQEKKALEKEIAEKQRILEVFKKTNKDKYKDLECRKALLAKLEKELGFSATNKEKELTTRELNGKRLAFENSAYLLKLEKRKARLEKVGTKVTIETEFPFSLEEKFQKWYERSKLGRKTGTCLLFGDLPRKGPSFLEGLDVKFSVTGSAAHGKSKQIAKDAGGPSRQFLTILWSHMGNLKVNKKSQPDVKLKSDRPTQSGQKKDNDSVELFDSSEDVLVPASDEFLGRCTIENIATAEAYYQALGRVITFCLFNRMHLSNHVLPQLYRNYLFRGLSPTNNGYEFGDLIQHFMELKGNFKRVEDIDSVVNFILAVDDDQKYAAMTPQERARHIIEDQYIAGRSIALNALENGISLSGAVEKKEILKVFEGCPLDGINRIVFLKQKVEIDDVTSILKPDYSEDSEPILLETQKSVLRINLSTGKAEGVLVDVIDRLAQERSYFLNEFIRFVSGYDFIPHTGFQITVEFNPEEMNADHLPVAHSCDNTLKFPAQAYDGNAEVLEMKLLTSLQYTERGVFDMH